MALIGASPPAGFQPSAPKILTRRTSALQRMAPRAQSSVLDIMWFGAIRTLDLPVMRRRRVCKLARRRLRASRCVAMDERPPLCLASETSKRSAMRERYVLPWPQLLQNLDDGCGPACVVILCGANPGNIGAVLRISALLGVSAVCVLGGLTGNAVTKALRTSQLERKPHWNVALVPVPEEETAVDALGRLRSAGVRLVGLTAETDSGKGNNNSGTKVLPVWDVELAKGNLGLVFGSDEFDGEPFPAGVAELFESAVTVPMHSSVSQQRASDTQHTAPEKEECDCLNLSTAAAIVVYERMKQMATKPNRAPQLVWSWLRGLWRGRAFGRRRTC